VRQWSEGERHEGRPDVKTRKKLNVRASKSRGDPLNHGKKVTTRQHEDASTADEEGGRYVRGGPPDGEIQSGDVLRSAGSVPTLNTTQRVPSFIRGLGNRGPREARQGGGSGGFRKPKTWGGSRRVEREREQRATCERLFRGTETERMGTERGRG